MKAYWDTSALIQAASDLALRARVKREQPYTRTPSLAEAFSAFTGGNPGIRVDACDAAATLENLAADLEFVDLNPAEVLAVFKAARNKDVRGGRVHDYCTPWLRRTAKLPPSSPWMKMISPA